ncbi:hypothetical protein [Cellulomonas sp. Root485]|uniref:DUF6414 family protein n=1 Tax=Cellulomonas sp. Root485 TaxID=1736546 RepID=UPI0012FC87D6|nr:hypothetical protein [Cellulomonas sp. Root485]
MSQKSTLLEHVSEEMSRAAEAELTSSISADAVVAKGEVAARYQTSNSNSIQTSRKAIIQTLFKEFRELSLNFLLAPPYDVSPLPDTQAIASSAESDIVSSSAAFARGTLVEIEVELAVDPVFELGTMMTEWTAMADEFPGMFAGAGGLETLLDAQPVMRVLDRLLAGLIPIKATATKHVVVQAGGQEFVVHKDALAGFDIEQRPLTLVGVTEHIGYWKDIRRVLFAGGRFTVLCRVARDGLHDSWTPVKLADLFSEVAPDLVGQINAIRFPGRAGGGVREDGNPTSALGIAMLDYRDALVLMSGANWPGDADNAFRALQSHYSASSMSASLQREAFDAVGALVQERLDFVMEDAGGDLEARRRARESAGLPLFPTLVPSAPAQAVRAVPPSQERLLDVEVIAIYW